MSNIDQVINKILEGKSIREAMFQATIKDPATGKYQDIEFEDPWNKAKKDSEVLDKYVLKYLPKISKFAGDLWKLRYNAPFVCENCTVTERWVPAIGMEICLSIEFPVEDVPQSNLSNLKDSTLLAYAKKLFKAAGYVCEYISESSHVDDYVSQVLFNFIVKEFPDGITVTFDISKETGFDKIECYKVQIKDWKFAKVQGNKLTVSLPDDRMALKKIKLHRDFSDCDLYVPVFRKNGENIKYVCDLESWDMSLSGGKSYFISCDSKGVYVEDI